MPNICGKYGSKAKKLAGKNVSRFPERSLQK